LKAIFELIDAKFELLPPNIEVHKQLLGLFELLLVTIE